MPESKHSQIILSDVWQLKPVHTDSGLTFSNMVSVYFSILLLLVLFRQRKYFLFYLVWIVIKISNTFFKLISSKFRQCSLF